MISDGIFARSLTGIILPPAHTIAVIGVDFSGNVIPGLYCVGESAGGFSLHGLARCTVQGRIAGENAAVEAPES
jgi:succinate dehydrogenase/fumarate reductase flavoprotein subunit